MIIGAGGHGRVAADVASQMGYERIAFLDDAQLPGVIGKTSDFSKYLNSADFFVAIGNSKIREQLICELNKNGANLVSLIHPSAIISEKAEIGTGVIVMAGAVVNTDAVLGNGVIVNTCASVDHDCYVSEFSHVSVGAHICGTVTIGNHTWIGAGATVINNVSICSNCIIGAGAVVIGQITEEGTYVGIPAGKVK